MKARNLLPASWLYALKLPFKRWAYELIDQLVLHFIPAGKSEAILIYRLDLLGDYLMCRPFFRALKQSPEYKNAPLFFAGNQILKGLAEELDAEVLDGFFWLDRNRFINSLGYRFRMLAAIRRMGFSTVIYPSHTRQFWLESIVRVSGAGTRITGSSVGKYMNEMEQALSAGWYSKVAETGSKPLFEFYRNRAFFQAIAPAAGGVSSLFESCFKEIKKQNLILLAPGASTSERQWPAENFARLLSELSLLFPLHRFGLIGAASERETAERIISISGTKARNYAGALSLPESMNLLAQAILLISNESGPVHMAATTGTACVCISNGNHFSRWNPYPESLANNILTCYPASFGNAEENKEKLTRLYHNHSSLPASEVAFSDVLQSSVALLKQIPEQPE